ncbi:MAG TPA: hypothetical protein VLI42_01745, partial [Chthoniobacterales bacterium]|nr:hypothetical protein [Chthoniobacterales bacterium]
MKTWTSRIAAFGLTTSVLFLAVVSRAAAQEPSIDNLLKKLPPPEKLVKTPVQRAAQQQDSALKDPLGREVMASIQRRDLHHATELTRQLVARYPRSFAVHLLLAALL